MSTPARLELLVVDMQPIDPPVGGGRLRLLGLYHAMGPALRARYFGTYDWPGAAWRKHALSPELEETDVPLSPRHFAANDRWSASAGGRTMIDLTFDWLGHASTDYVRQGAAAIDPADAVIFSHPWCYPLFRDQLRPGQLVIYDSQNCEAVLRAQLWDDGSAGTELARHVALLESELIRRADATWVCSAEDAGQFVRIYGADERRLVEVPNGVFTERTRPPTPAERAAAREHLGLAGPVALFIGSMYPPNVEAVEAIARRLAPALPELTFVVAGGVSASEDAKRLAAGAANVRLTGALGDAERTRWLHAADLGLNPMSSGSGTNIKMFDFMAAGLPTLATPTGARGIAPCEGVVVAELDGLVPALRTWSADTGLRARGGAAARALACERYSWERISPWLGEVVLERWRQKQAAAAAPRSGHLRVVSAAAEPSPPARAAGPRPVAVVSTWNSACGIAEYTRYLSRALATRGVETLLVNGATVPVRLAATASDTAPSLRVEDMRPCYEPDPGGVAAACAAAGIKDLSVQYHSAFFSEEALRKMVVAARLEDIRVSLTCHDSKRMSPEGLARIASAGARLVVHNQDEVVRLQELGADQVEYLPMGVLELGDRPAGEARSALGWSGGPVVATFGFLRPHKGLPELIQAFDFVRDAFPAARLLALTALYQSEDSRSCLQTCKALLAERGLDRDPGVQLETAFLPIDEVVRRLHAADLVVLPYHRSDEGASASAAVALAARRPVVTTPSPIFDDLAGYTYETGAADPFCLGLAICNVLSSPELREHLRERSRAFVDARSWAQVASRFERLLFAPGRWRPPAADERYGRVPTTA
ncbi:MAG TPA: glycosyltransferase [Myxococcaceae bacterium]|jgi:glycosyltransferase involved in cell wall biosynthesis